MPPPRLLVTSLLVSALLGMAGPAATPQKPARITGAEKVQVSLVLIDVVVRDRKDRPVAGLTRDDFELLVDRLPVAPLDIESFEEICPAQPAASVPPPSTASASPPATPAPEPPPSTAAVGTEPRYIVLYFDFSQLSFGGRRQALKSARDHLAARIGPTDRVMILAFKKSLRLVQDFTSDASLLAARLDELRNDATTVDSDVLEEGQNMCDVASRPCEPTSLSCRGRLALATTYAAKEELRARRSLQTIEGLMPSLARIRGRKALVLFTDVLRQEPGVQYAVMAKTLPQGHNEPAPEDAAGVNRQPALLRLTKEANASGVSIYTVHASGLDDPDIATFRDCSVAGTVVATELSMGRSETLDAARSGLDSALALQTTMAVETGGRALQRSNDVGAILDAAQQDLSCYYLLGYRYQGHGDDRRHSILVKLKPDANGEPRRGLSLRYRPYYTDVSPADRRLRLIRSALEAPELYHRLPISTEAFALAPEGTKRRVLIKATVPLDALSMVPIGDSTLEGHVSVRGEVTSSTGSGSPACSFEQELPLKVPRGAQEARRLVFETGCLLGPGSYDLALTVFDPTTQEIGASRTTLVVPRVSLAKSAFVSEVHLWTREAGALVVSAGAEQIGLKDTSSETAWVPRSERRLDRGQEALMSFLLCPAEGTHPTKASPIQVRRTLRGEADAAVASFRDLSITEPPDAATGCYQIFNTIPGNSLGDGIYRFTIQLSGPVLGAPVTREADIAVD